MLTPWQAAFESSIHVENGKHILVVSNPQVLVNCDEEDPILAFEWNDPNIEAAKDWANANQFVAPLPPWRGSCPCVVTLPTNLWQVL